MREPTRDVPLLQVRGAVADGMGLLLRKDAKTRCSRLCDAKDRLHEVH